jgi:alanine racemase
LFECSFVQLFDYFCPVSYSIHDIAKIVEGDLISEGDKTAIEQILLDSRKVVNPSSAIFFALKGPRRDGHQFISDLYQNGVRNFVVSETQDGKGFQGGNFILVNDVLQALQKLASWHRKQFDIPVIGITGSNGKTIVKEWLYQLLHEDFSIARSPKSYNSQIGVPLSLWQLNSRHQLGIFEAGISQPHEMERLEKIIFPTIGVLTNIGEAHSEGFSDQQQKLDEKLKLFVHAGIVIASGDNKLIREAIRSKQFPFFSWGKNTDCTLIIKSIKKEPSASFIDAEYKSQKVFFSLPFSDDASIENAITCCCVMLALEIKPVVIADRMNRLQPVNMRLELKKGINNCVIINDSYSADLSSLHIAMNFLSQQKTHFKRRVILSDFYQTGLDDAALYKEIASLLAEHDVQQVTGIGPNIARHLRFSGQVPDVEFFNSTEEFIRQFRSSRYRDEAILVKGARIFEFEKIVHLLEQKVHQTQLEINLNAIANNLRQYQQLLKHSTKVMAMVKAFAYGSGGAEIAGLLQYHRADYLGVAYADEGTELRQAGISLPIMVMNPDPASFQALVDNDLEPDIYSFGLLQEFDQFLRDRGLQQYPVHLEIETGMNRLGFAVNEISRLGDFLNQADTMNIRSVFSHLASSEDAAQDDFTMQQYEKFISAAEVLEHYLGYRPLRHIANSAAVARHAKLQLDMIRLGIGMYGVDSTSSPSLNLQPVAALKSTVAQLKNLKPGESVSYNRIGVVHRDSVIATIRIGYADGYPRRLGNGIGKMRIHDQFAPVIGTVCMDMTMIDVTDIPGVKEGDDVIVFGEGLSIGDLARAASTIPYEIMTGISQRVKRVYFEE